MRGLLIAVLVLGLGCRDKSQEADANAATGSAASQEQTADAHTGDSTEVDATVCPMDDVMISQVDTSMDEDASAADDGVDPSAANFCDLPPMDIAPTAEQIEAFGKVATWGSQEIGPIEDVDMYVDKVGVVLFGRLSGAGPGRIEHLAPCIYSAFANLELSCVEVIKGSLSDPSQPAYLELDWALNLGVEHLREATPVGARVIFLGGDVKGALESAQAVDAEGNIGAVDRVKTNLFGVPYNGLLVEGMDGKTYAPLYDAPLLLNGAEQLENFEDAMATIRAAVER